MVQLVDQLLRVGTYNAFLRLAAARTSLNSSINVNASVSSSTMGISPSSLREFSFGWAFGGIVMDCRGGVGNNGRCIVSYSRFGLKHPTFYSIRRCTAFSLPYSSISLTEESSHRKQSRINRYLQFAHKNSLPWANISQKSIYNTLPSVCSSLMKIFIAITLEIKTVI